MLIHAFSEVRLAKNNEVDIKVPISIVQISSYKPNNTQNDNTEELVEPFIIHVYPFNNIEFIKRIIINKSKRNMRVKDIILYYNGFELNNKAMVLTFIDSLTDFGTKLNDDCTSSKDSATEKHNMAINKIVFKWRIKEKLKNQLNIQSIRISADAQEIEVVKYIIAEANEAFSHHVIPKLTMEGTGGTYILYNKYYKPLAIFKPQDEEAFTPNNPRGYVGKFDQIGFRNGVHSGEGCYREVAVYALDLAYSNFSSVPPTQMVDAIHPSFCYDLVGTTTNQFENNVDIDLPFKKKKLKSLLNKEELHYKTGSLQQYINCYDTAADFDPNLFAVYDVHRIAILDIRICNLDRNDGNILVVRNEFIELDKNIFNLFASSPLEPWLRHDTANSTSCITKVPRLRLIPIDHSLSLPDTLNLNKEDIAWYYWPQAKIPFSNSILLYIKSLNAENDAKYLIHKINIRTECVRLMQCSVSLLKIGASNNLTAFDIMGLMMRDSPTVPSAFENAISLALSQAFYAQFYSTANIMRHKLFENDYIVNSATQVNRIIGASNNKKSFILESKNKFNNTNGAYSEEHNKIVNFDEKNDKNDIKNTLQRTSKIRHNNQTTLRISESFTNSNLLNPRKHTVMSAIKPSFKSNCANNTMWSVVDVHGQVVKIDIADNIFFSTFLSMLENQLELLVSTTIKSFNTVR